MRLFTPLAIAFASALVACKSPTAADKGAAAGKTIESAAGQVDEGIAQLDATLAALASLVKKPAPDLGPQYKAFTKSLGQLESTAEDVSALAAKIDAKGQAYFTEWDAQIAAVQNENIRERTASRREAVSASFKKLQDEYGEVKGEFKPMLDNLRDIRTALGADLTMEGLKAVEDTVEDVADNAESVRESLQELSKGFRDLGVKLSKSGPPAEAEAKK
jgi:chromosome segregation ATPase